MFSLWFLFFGTFFFLGLSFALLIYDENSLYFHGVNLFPWLGKKNYHSRSSSNKCIIIPFLQLKFLLVTSKSKARSSSSGSLVAVAGFCLL